MRGRGCSSGPRLLIPAAIDAVDMSRARLPDASTCWVPPLSRATSVAGPRTVSHWPAEVAVHYTRDDRRRPRAGHLRGKDGPTRLPAQRRPAALALSGLPRFGEAFADKRLRVGVIGSGWYGKQPVPHAAGRADRGGLAVRRRLRDARQRGSARGRAAGRRRSGHARMATTARCSASATSTWCSWRRRTTGTRWP